MKRKEFKETLFEALNNVVDGMSYDDKMILVHNLLVDYERIMKKSVILPIKVVNGQMKN